MLCTQNVLLNARIKPPAITAGYFLLSGIENVFTVLVASLVFFFFLDFCRDIFFMRLKELILSRVYLAVYTNTDVPAAHHIAARRLSL